MITTASLKELTVKDLGQMAKDHGVQGWHSMRKDDLVKAIVRKNAARKRAATLSKGKNSSAKSASTNGKSSTKEDKTRTDRARRVSKKLQREQVERQRMKDLTASHNGQPDGEKDRIVLMVRDPYWLHVCWELTRQNVQRAKASMAEHWHTSKPILRLFEVEVGATTSTAERHIRDIDIHGGVKNWYIDVKDPPNDYRVDIGYLAANGRFHALSRSNTVSTPRPGGDAAFDSNWTAVAENFERVYALSGGYADDKSSDLQDMFEERLGPIGAPSVFRFGAGAQGVFSPRKEFQFDVEAEMVVFGTTKADAYVTIGGEPVKVEQDGTFSVRMAMPDRRQVLPVVASSSDGVERRTTVLAVERNTKVMEPVFREPDED